MLIRINKSKLFNNPSDRFSQEYGVPVGMWTEMWKRYKILEYTIPDLADYFNIKTNRQIRRRQLRRWIFLTEIYILSKPAREKGAEVINTEMFGKLEERVIQEATRHMRSGSTQNTRLLA